jgi:hypothetical protein
LLMQTLWSVRPGISQRGKVLRHLQDDISHKIALTLWKRMFPSIIFQHCFAIFLWSSGQSSWLQIQIRRYQIFWEVLGLERGRSTSWVQLRGYLKEKVAAPV